MTTTFASGATSTTGTLTLSGNNSGYSGNIIITGGTLIPAMSANTVLGTGPITLAGGKLALQGQVSGSSTQTYSNDLNLTANSTVDVSGSLNAYMRNLSAGTATLAVTSADTTTNPYSLNFQATSQNTSPTFNISNSAGGGHGSLNLYTSAADIECGWLTNHHQRRFADPPSLSGIFRDRWNSRLRPPCGSRSRRTY